MTRDRRRGEGISDKRPGLSRGPEVPRECPVWLGYMGEGGRSRDELQRWVGTIHKLRSLCCSCPSGVHC